MTTTQINYINIFLMIVSAAIAFALPFELFLFSYAVLGPLHYLTEISWLHDRKYFSTGKFDYLWLCLPAIPATAAFIYNIKFSFDWITLLIWVAFGSAFGMALFKRTMHKVILTATLVLCGLLLSNFRPYAILVTIFLPTIIHVFVFTGAFILYGALKSKSNSGYASFIVFLLCGFIFFIYPVSADGYIINEYIERSIKPFMNVNKKLSAVLGVNQDWNGTVIVMRFIAYAYTYHYLNWFSKTNVIRWHQISYSRMAAILIAWTISLVIYAIDYRLGYITLFFLSLLHVLLEFPLNHQSFVGIWGMLKKR